MYEKEIVYDRHSGDYAMYLDGELVGFTNTYSDAEITLDQLVFELEVGRYFREVDDPNPAPEEPKAPKESEAPKVPKVPSKARRKKSK